MSDKSKVRRVAIIGGGVSGLSAAYALARARQAGAAIEELLFEAGPWLGGVIRTENVDGFLVEGGPDSFLAEKPQAAAMAHVLGLGDDLMGSNDNARKTYIVHRGRLVPLPDGLMFLAPTQVWPVINSPLLPFGSKIALARELFMSPPGRDNGDESVASFVRRHFGSGMVENIADPLLAGVYGGDSAELSVRSVLPRLWEMERQWGSLTRGAQRALRERNASAKKASTTAATSEAAPKQPLFMTLTGGLQQMTYRLSAQVDKNRIHMCRRVAGLEYSPGGPDGAADSCSRRFLISCEGDKKYDADAVILALPANIAGGIVSELDARLGELLAGIPYTSSLTVSLGYDENVKASLPAGFGFLVPRKEQKRMLACTFVHAKFKHRVPDGKAMLRCFLGGARDPDVLTMPDEDIVFGVRRELQSILGLQAEPLFYRVHRWQEAMAQYPVGHATRVRDLEDRLLQVPGIYLAGNGYSGIGISDCLRMGKTAADKALDFVARGARPAKKTAGTASS